MLSAPAAAAVLPWC